MTRHGELFAVTARWFDNDDLFRHLLAEGHRWAAHVVAYLRIAGLDVELTEMEWRETIDHRKEFADEYDLSVLGARVPIHVDVKSRDLSFTSPKDYPYPTAFVDTVSGWEAKIHKPSAVVLISQRTESMLVIPRSSEPAWTMTRQFDHVRRIEESFFAVPRECLVPMTKFVEWLCRQTQGELHG